MFDYNATITHGQNNNKMRGSDKYYLLNMMFDRMRRQEVKLDWGSTESNIMYERFIGWNNSQLLIFHLFVVAYFSDNVRIQLNYSWKKK